MHDRARHRSTERRHYENAVGRRSATNPLNTTKTEELQRRHSLQCGLDLHPTPSKPALHSQEMRTCLYGVGIHSKNTDRSNNQTRNNHLDTESNYNFELKRIVDFEVKFSDVLNHIFGRF